MLRQKPCRSHRKPRRNPPNTDPRRNALVGLKSDNRTSLPDGGYMKKLCAIVICAVVLSLPSGKAESIELVTTLALGSTALKVLETAISLFDSGADPEALRLQQTYDMVTQLNVRLNGYDTALTRIQENIENIPEIIRSEISNETARKRREAVKAVLDVIHENIEIISGGGKPVSRNQRSTSPITDCEVRINAARVGDESSVYRLRYGHGIGIDQEFKFLRNSKRHRGKL